MYSYLATPRATREVLTRYGLVTKKSLGQHFLVNDAIIGKIIDRAEVAPGEVILEVGPGIGTLTVGLLQAGAHVIAIERDADLFPVLRETTAAGISQFSSNETSLALPRFAYIGADALSVTRDQLCALCDEASVGSLPFKLVANLPYGVAATVVLEYFQRFDFLKEATVMVQTEVAERMMARPGSKEYGAYTVKLSLYAAVAGSFKVAPTNFLPPPHVGSTVISLKRRSASVDDINEHDRTSENLLAAASLMADAAFTQRRKTIRNSMMGYWANNPQTLQRIPGIDVAELVDTLLERAGIAATLRGERLEVAEYLALGRAFLDVTG
jgi:16S rRNA (adenine1518-N6/adenine1519-N6)-dimethyltransferase